MKPTLRAPAFHRRICCSNPPRQTSRTLPALRASARNRARNPFLSRPIARQIFHPPPLSAFKSRSRRQPNLRLPSVSARCLASSPAAAAAAARQRVVAAARQRVGRQRAAAAARQAAAAAARLQAIPQLRRRQCHWNHLPCRLVVHGSLDVEVPVAPRMEINQIHGKSQLLL